MQALGTALWADFVEKGRGPFRAPPSPAGWGAHCALREQRLLAGSLQRLGALPSCPANPELERLARKMSGYQVIGSAF